MTKEEYNDKIRQELGYIGTFNTSNYKIKKEKVKRKKICIWKLYQLTHNPNKKAAHTKCNNEFLLLNDNFKYYKFCPYCGGEIEKYIKY